MANFYSTVSFIGFAEFLVKENQSLLEEPIRGDLRVFLSILIEKEGTDNWELPVHLQNYHQFESFVEQFNEISGNSLKIEHCGGTSKIVWMNFANIMILQDSMGNKRIGNVKFKEKPIDTNMAERGVVPDSTKLLSILNEPLFTSVDVSISNNPLIKCLFQVNYTSLETLLNYTSAQRYLATEKIKLRRDQKVFYDICSDVSHINTLTNVCFNRKDWSQGVGRRNFPDLKTFYSKIESSQSMIPQAAYKCSQTKIHYLPVMNNQTDLSLGDCSYLDTCHKMKSCRYLHYFTLCPLNQAKKIEFLNNEECSANEYTLGECFTEYTRDVLPAQWIDCDVRHLPFSILGKFAVIISDPAWDIHMSLPYGTCKDTELLLLDIPSLQDEGIIFLWVTGRSIEVGRKALLKWGYEISDEMVWVKLNQLKRTIVTGRTGHWLNHSKEHLLVGVKGNPAWLNKKIDSEVIVSGTRETSRKPDEVYDIAERLVGCHARKLEIFGRDHNTRPGWFTIGNQLNKSRICEPEVKQKYEEYLRSKGMKN